MKAFEGVVCIWKIPKNQKTRKCKKQGRAQKMKREMGCFLKVWIKAVMNCEDTSQ